MKVLRIVHSYFHLPDDFTGDVFDAMELYIAYHREIGIDNQKYSSGTPLPKDMTPEKIWSDFLAGVKSKEFKSIMAGCVKEWKDGKWVDVPIAEENLVE